MNELPDQNYKLGILMVDIFTKYTEVIPLKDKTEGSRLSGLMENLTKLEANLKRYSQMMSLHYLLNILNNFSKTII